MKEGKKEKKKKKDHIVGESNCDRGKAPIRMSFLLKLQTPPQIIKFNEDFLTAINKPLQLAFFFFFVVDVKWLKVNKF